MFIVCGARLLFSSVRSEMCQMPLLTELGETDVIANYKHPAPLGLEF